MGPDGGRAGPGGGTGGGTSSTPSTGAPTSRAGMATQTRAEARRSGVYGQVDAQAMGAVTNGAIASFDDATENRGFMGQVQAQSRPGLAVDMGPGLTQGDLETVANDIQANASPGLLGRVASIGTGILTANPFAGLAVDTGFRAHDAASQIGQLNDDFDAGLDDSFSGNLGRQAVGAVGGLAGSRAGSTVGGLIGRSLGPAGQIVGMMGGSMAGQGFGRDVAMNGFDGQGAQGSTPGAGVAGGGGGASSGATMTAGTTQPQAGTPAAQAPASNGYGYGPASLTGYASYATSFFA